MNLLVNRLCDADGDLEGGGGFMATDLGISLFADAAEEGFEFGFEGFFAFEGNGFALQLAIFLTNEVARLFHEVEGQVTFILENADFAKFFGADAGSVDVGDAAIGELDAGIGDILFSAEDVDADGIDALHRGTDELLNNADIMDHEIEDNADLGAALDERGQAIGGDIERLSNIFLEVTHDRIEVLNVADLDKAVTFFGDVEEAFGILQIGANGFFDEGMGTGLEDGNGHIGMEVGGDGNADGFALGGQFFGGGEDAGTVFIRDFLGALVLGIDDTD